MFGNHLETVYEYVRMVSLKTSQCIHTEYLNILEHANVMEQWRQQSEAMQIE